MTKRLFSTLSMVVLLIAASCKQSDMQTTIKEQSKLLIEATKKEDYATLIKFTYPKVTEMVGGESKMLEMIETGMGAMKKEGIVMEVMELGEPGKIYTGKDELYCLIPETIVMKFPDKKEKLKMKSNLLGISKDKGKHWYFLDCNAEEEKIREIVPGLNPELKIPELVHEFIQ